MTDEPTRLVPPVLANATPSDIAEAQTNARAKLKLAKERVAAKEAKPKPAGPNRLVRRAMASKAGQKMAARTLELVTEQRDQVTTMLAALVLREGRLRISEDELNAACELGALDFRWDAEAKCMIVAIEGSGG
jgi:hypothetical protein